MKRRYKAGDWLRVPLGGEFDALALIARACRSRLFGYFFAVPASHVPSHGDLRALRPDGAIAALLFGGEAIERARWPLVATSLAYDPAAWPFPVFGSRGAFGEAWTQVRYDPDTLQIVERVPIDRERAALLPDARFAGAHEVETVLRRRIAGDAPERALSVCEVRSPLDVQRLQSLERGGCVQFSTPLRAAELAQLARFIEANPHVALRVHGFRHGFDAAHLAAFTVLRDLTLDAPRIQHAHVLRELRSLRRMRIGAAQIGLDFLETLPELRDLELRGTRADLAPLLRAGTLETLVLENTAPLELTRMASAHTLRSLVLAHGAYELRGIAELAQLERLELRALDVTELPALQALERLAYLHLDALAAVRDLTPIAHAPALQELRITAMPQLNVDDFGPLQRCAGLRRLDVAIGSRRKEREINRALKAGNICQV